MYVANLANGTNGYITQYSSAGVENTRFLITDGISTPSAITIAGVDDLYVLNSPNVTVYPLADTFNGPFLLTAFTFDASGCSPLQCAIAVHAGDFYVGALSASSNPNGPFWEKGFVSEWLAGSGRFPVFQSTPAGVVALATDGAGDLYVVTGIVNGKSDVDFWGPKGGPVGILELSFAPASIAVDSARGRIYVSDLENNQVVVYSTKGTLLHTIRY